MRKKSTKQRILQSQNLIISRVVSLGLGDNLKSGGFCL